MRRVAAKADVSLSTVVRHFGTKDALLAALVGQGGEDEERDALRRSMEPGDVAAAVRVVVGDYEEAGQQLMHMLAQEHRFPALSELLDLGRRGHRTWVRWAFSPQLAGRSQRREDAGSRTCWSSPRTCTRGSSSASTGGSARERRRRR